MSRYPNLLRPFLLAAFVGMGAIAAHPAFAVSISNITANPNPLPSAGGAVPVFITCTSSVGTPTGSATLTNSNGTVLSQNTCSFYNYDANGNPVLYTYLVVQPNNSITSSAYYTVNATASDQAGSTQVSKTFQQSYGNPLIINSLTATPNPIPASGTSLQVNVNLTDNGPNQKGFYKGQAALTDSSGTILDIEPLFPLGLDSNGNKNYYSTLNNVPVNMTSSARSYTVSITAVDKAGVTVSNSIGVSQLSGSVSIAPTSLSVSSVSGVAGQPAPLAASLVRATDGAALSGKNVTFQVDGSTVATTSTNSSGVASYSYTLPASFGPGNHTITSSFAGDSGDSASSGTATLIATTPALPVFANAGFEAVSVGNASYRYNLTGGSWTFTGYSGIQSNASAWYAANAPDGTQTAFLQGYPGPAGLGAMSQTIYFAAPGNYALTFQAARRFGQVQPLKISVDGMQVGGLLTPPSSSFSLMTSATFTISTAGNHTITLGATTGGSDASTLVDQVAISSK